MNKLNLQLSIIVPVYNVENYLETCISSLVNQDLDKDTYEIVTINDGSTDNSLFILEQLKAKYPNTNIKIITQENQGLSGARNTGFDNANGTYLICVDSDDTLLPDTIKPLINIAQNNHLDILEFGALGVMESGHITFTAKFSTNGKVLTGENYLATISYLGSACNKVYNRRFLNQNKLRFMPNVYIEDIEFNTRAVFKCHRIMATDMIAASFLQRQGSITRTKNFVKSKKMIYDIFTVLSSINHFNNTIITSSSPAFPVVKKRVTSLVATMLKRVLHDTKDYSIKKDIINKLKQVSLYPTPEGYKPNNKSKKMFLLFANNKLLFSVACRLKCWFNMLKPD